MVATPYEDLARSLARAWLTGVAVALPAPVDSPQCRAEAFAVQDRVAELVGDRCIGWKVGAAVLAIQVKEGRDGPIVGRLLANRQFVGSSEISARRFAGYKVESELAFRFKKAVPARALPYSRAELVDDLVLHCGLEIAGNRYSLGSSDRKPTTYELIADNGACGAYIEGPGVEAGQGIDFGTLLIDARIDGGPAIDVFSGEFYRDPVEILVETVNGLSARGQNINAGDLLTTGSLTLPTALHVGQTYVADFGSLATLAVTLV